MQIKLTATLFLSMLVVFTSCSKKNHPEKTETVVVKKTVVKKTVIPVSKVITVDDRAAKRSGDGRLYYDFSGRRYWKNFDDGKYYLYNKSLFSNPAFRPH